MNYSSWRAGHHGFRRRMERIQWLVVVHSLVPVPADPNAVVRSEPATPVHGTQEEDDMRRNCAGGLTMADPFATGLTVLMRGPRSVAADYRAAGVDPAIPIRAVRHEGTEDMPFGDTVIPAGVIMIEIDRREVAEPTAGDTVTIAGELLAIVGEPRLERQGLIWLCEAPPAT